MASSLRIAILECDTPLEKTRAKYGGYAGVFEALFRAAAQRIEYPDSNLVFSHYDVVNGVDYPSLDDIDAVLLTGSRHNSFDDDAWIKKLVAFTESVLAQNRVRLVGVCFGHQIIGRAMKVKVGRSDKGWEASICDVDLTARGKELFEGKPKLGLMQMHKDIVYGFPDGVEPLGHSPRCENQGMYAKQRLITVQGHPEFTEQIVRELLETRHDQKIFDDVTYDDGMKRVGNHNDGVLVAGAFLRFLLDGRETNGA